DYLNEAAGVRRRGIKDPAITVEHEVVIHPYEWAVVSIASRGRAEACRVVHAMYDAAGRKCLMYWCDCPCRGRRSKLANWLLRPAPRARLVQHSPRVIHQLVALHQVTQTD